VFRSSVVWRLVLVYFFIQVGFYGLNQWLPHLVKTTIGGSYLVVGAVIAIPYLFALAGLWINARSADRTGRYSVHVMASLAIGAVALVLSVASGSIAALSVFLVSIAAVALVLGGLVVLTLRRQADKPVLVAQPEAAAAPRPETAASHRPGVPHGR
jgi:MFS family permease